MVEAGVWLRWQASGGLLSLPPQHGNYSSMLSDLALYVGTGDLNSYPQTCTASVLPTELSPSTPCVLFQGALCGSWFLKVLREVVGWESR